jgi:trk system potassium uptake protein TrkA
VVIAATGDDKANLVTSLLAKTEYGVPRVVARINLPSNEWLFNESWGVDVAVSTPRLLSALVEEAVSVGDLVRLMTFRQSDATLVEMTMPADAPLAGQRVGSVDWPADTALVAILRDGRVIVPSSDDPLEGGDELLFVTSQDVEADLARLLHGEA